jgi:hypothetical protein
MTQRDLKEQLQRRNFLNSQSVWRLESGDLSPQLPVVMIALALNRRTAVYGGFQQGVSAQRLQPDKRFVRRPNHSTTRASK